MLQTFQEHLHDILHCEKRYPTKKWRVTCYIKVKEEQRQRRDIPYVQLRFQGSKCRVSDTVHAASESHAHINVL